MYVGKGYIMHRTTHSIPGRHVFKYSNEDKLVQTTFKEHKHNKIQKLTSPAIVCIKLTPFPHTTNLLQMTLKNI